MTRPLTHYISAELRAAKGRAGIKLDQIAERAGYSTATISDILNAKQLHNPDQGELIAEACGTTYAHIVVEAYKRFQAQKKAPHSEV